MKLAALLVLAVVAACGRHAAPAAAPPPVAAAAHEPPPPELCTGVETGGVCISVCVVQEGQLRLLPVSSITATGDTLVGGRRFRDAYPVDSAYAVSHRWFAEHEPIMYRYRRFVKYSLPRVLGITEVVNAGDFHGVAVFVEAGASGEPEVIYLPVRPGCQFQPYQLAEPGSAVRG